MVVARVVPVRGVRFLAGAVAIAALLVALTPPSAPLDPDPEIAAALALGLDRGDPVIDRRLARDLAYLDLGEDDAARIAAARQLDLHRTDPVIRRRLRQRLGDVVAAEIGEPSTAALDAWLAAHPERLQGVDRQTARARARLDWREDARRAAIAAFVGGR